MSRAGVLATATAVAALVTACVSETWAPERPAIVPDEAVYAGGLDGGNWMLCTGAVHDLTCRIWDIRGWEEYSSRLAPCTVKGVEVLADGRMSINIEYRRTRADEVVFHVGGEADLLELQSWYGKKGFHPCGGGR